MMGHQGRDNTIVSCGSSATEPVGLMNCQSVQDKAMGTVNATGGPNVTRVFLLKTNKGDDDNNKGVVVILWLMAAAAAWRTGHLERLARTIDPCM